MEQTVPYERTGRVGQKARTKDALVQAARALLARGEIPTMDSVASAAEVSRTTAYRYFPTFRALLVEGFPHIDRDSLLPEDAPADPRARLELVAEDQTRRVLDYEHEMRAVLGLSLTDRAAPELPMHRGLRIGWIEDALTPLRSQLDEDRFDRLVRAIGSVLGIEALVWLTDIAGLSREQAAETMRSNARAILESELG